MNNHRNAKLNLEGRKLLIQRIQTLGLSQAALSLSVSGKTARKWQRRYAQEGEAGLQDRSSRPHRLRWVLSESEQETLKAARRARLSMRLIAEGAGVSLATVSRTLARAGLSRWRDLQPKVPVVRYEKDSPGEMIHLDMKKLSRFAVPGHQATGVRSAANRGLGTEVLHIAIDDHSRLATTALLRDEGKVCALAFLRQTLDFYGSMGVKVMGLLTDNGAAYRSKAFACTCAALGITHRFTKPYTPKTNGKAERFIQTALREWAYGQRYQSSAQRAQELPDWQRFYNHERPHSSLQLRPPISRLEAVGRGNNVLKNDK